MVKSILELDHLYTEARSYFFYKYISNDYYLKFLFLIAMNSLKNVYLHISFCITCDLLHQSLNYRP